MDAEQIDAELRVRADRLTDRLRTQKGDDRRETMQDIAAVLRVRRLLSEQRT